MVMCVRRASERGAIQYMDALAHAGGGETDFSFERFKFLNVTCAENVFEACVSHNVSVLFISTVDAYHRVVDGMLGGNFLHFIADYLENWKG